MSNKIIKEEEEAQGKALKAVEALKVVKARKVIEKNNLFILSNNTNVNNENRALLNT